MEILAFIREDWSWFVYPSVDKFNLVISHLGEKNIYYSRIRKDFSGIVSEYNNYILMNSLKI